MIPKIKKEKQAVNQNLKHFLVQKHWMWLLHDSIHAIELVGAGILFFSVAFATHYLLFAALGVFIVLMGVIAYMIELYQFDKSYFACTSTCKVTFVKLIQFYHIDRDFLNHLQTITGFSDTTLHYHLIREVHIKQTMSGRMYGFAQVTLDSGGDDKVVLPYVSNHQQVKEYLITRIGPPANIKAPSPIVTDERGELKVINNPDYKKESVVPIKTEEANQAAHTQAKSKTTARLPKSKTPTSKNPTTKKRTPKTKPVAEDGVIYSRT
jgi:hypothetical protein